MGKANLRAMDKSAGKSAYEIYRDAYWRGVTAMKRTPFGKSYLEISNDALDTALRCIAAGERLYTLKRFKDLFEMRASGFVLPDFSHAGGIMELKKIAAAAEAYYIPFAPHNPSVPVANASTLQPAACL